MLNDNAISNSQHYDGGFGHSSGRIQTIPESSPLGTQYGNLDKNLVELRQRLDTLGDKLQPVLAAPRPIAGGSADPQATNYTSPLAHSISEDTARVRDMILTVSDLIDRVEL